MYIRGADGSITWSCEHEIELTAFHNEPFQFATWEGFFYLTPNQ